MSASKILALTALFLTTVVAQTEWKEFTSAEGNFRILVPETPQQQIVAERNLHQFSASAGAESYGLAYRDFPPNTDWENTVNSERDSIVNGLHGSVIDESVRQSKVIPGNGSDSSDRIRVENLRSTSWSNVYMCCMLLLRTVLLDQKTSPRS